MGKTLDVVKDRKKIEKATAAVFDAHVKAGAELEGVEIDKDHQGFMRDYFVESRYEKRRIGESYKAHVNAARAKEVDIKDKKARDGHVLDFLAKVQHHSYGSRAKDLAGKLKGDKLEGKELENFNHEIERLLGGYLRNPDKGRALWERLGNGKADKDDWSQFYQIMQISHESDIDGVISGRYKKDFADKRMDFQKAGNVLGAYAHAATHGDVSVDAKGITNFEGLEGHVKELTDHANRLHDSMREHSNYRKK